MQKRILCPGDEFDFPGWGKVKFVGFDYYHGQRTAEIYSEKFRQRGYPLPYKIEDLGYELQA